MKRHLLFSILVFAFYFLGGCAVHQPKYALLQYETDKGGEPALVKALNPRTAVLAQVEQAVRERPSSRILLPTQLENRRTWLSVEYYIKESSEPDVSTIILTAVKPRPKLTSWPLEPIVSSSQPEPVKLASFWLPPADTLDLLIHPQGSQGIPTDVMANRYAEIIADFRIDATGALQDIEVRSEIGSSVALTRYIRENLSRWTFQPESANGEPLVDKRYTTRICIEKYADVGSRCRLEPLPKSYEQGRFGEAKRISPPDGID